MSLTFEQLQARMSWLTLKPEEWHQHPNGGGWVQNTAKVEATVYIDGDARVYGDAQVSGDAREFSPLQIQGTRHFLTTCAHDKVAIGCQVHTPAEWMKRYQEIGRANGYTPAQIAEYGLLLKLAEDWLKMKFTKAVATKKAVKKPTKKVATKKTAAKAKKTAKA